MIIDLVPAHALIVSAAVAPADTDNDHVSSPVVLALSNSLLTQAEPGDTPLDTPMHLSPSAGLDVEPTSRRKQKCPAASR